MVNATAAWLVLGGLWLLVLPGCQWILLLLLILITVGKVFHLRLQFLYGCTNPAVVVSTSPPRIAVYTDLSISPAAVHPYIKVVRQPLAKKTGELPPVGTRLATVSLYSGPVVNGHWSNFHPIAAGLAADEETAEATMSNLPPYYWDLLAEAVATLPAGVKPGLYPVAQKQG